MATRDPSQQADRIPQLSCELCRARKIKCDKLSPCTNCLRARVPCVPVHRRRLPRGRHVQTSTSDNDLVDRVRRLEALISAMNSNPSSSGQTPAMETSPCSTVRGSPRTTRSPSPPAAKAAEESTGRRVGQHFWADLVEEIHGLRGLVDQPTADEEDQSRTSHANQAKVGSSILGLGPGYTGGLRSLVAGFLALRPTPAVCAQLCEVYLRQVDPIIKILHRPSLVAFMADGKPYLGYEHGHVAVEALGSAVCYAAINTMTEEQCQSMFHASKSAVVPDYRVACEGALERAGLITTRDITVLQAFVLYLAATRSQDKSAVWTLVSVAVRIARALFLNLDDHRPSESFFDGQMRKRLWYTISVLDMQSSFNEASEPLISLDLPQPSLPRNVNDSEFDQNFDGDLPDREGLTDATMALVVWSAQAGGRALNFMGFMTRTAGEKAQSLSSASYNWDARLHHVQQYEQHVAKLLQYCDPSTSAYAWFTFHGSQSLVATMKLAALRPLQRAGRGAPPRVQGSSDLLKMSGSVLEKVHMISTDPRGEGFRWYVTIQWHTLAIAVTECYVCNDVSLISCVWPLIEASFEHHSKASSGQRQSQLQKPIEKLMQQTRNRISTLLSGSGSMSVGSSLLTPPDPDLFQTARSSAPASISMPVPSPQIPLSLNLPDQSDPTIATPQVWYPAGSFASAAGTMAPVATGSQTDVPQTISDPTWGTWTDFINDLSFDEIASAGFPGSLYDNNFGPTMHFPG